MNSPKNCLEFVIVMTKEVVFILFFSFSNSRVCILWANDVDRQKKLSNLSLAMNTNYLILSICRVPTLYVLDCSSSWDVIQFRPRSSQLINFSARSKPVSSGSHLNRLKLVSNLQTQGRFDFRRSLLPPWREERKLLSRAVFKPNRWPSLFQNPP